MARLVTLPVSAQRRRLLESRLSPIPTRDDSSYSVGPAIGLSATEKAPVGSLQNPTFPAKKKAKDKQEGQDVGPSYGICLRKPPRARKIPVPFPRVRLLLVMLNAARAVRDLTQVMRSTWKLRNRTKNLEKLPRLVGASRLSASVPSSPLKNISPTLQ